jgi:glycosyltransferase involved in cell wall biosynthesis
MKASVLLPVYNAGPHLRAAIDSILSQDEPDFEFLIIDDCSNDGSRDVIRAYAAKDPRIRPVLHAKNIGLAATLNQGLAESKCEFVLRMDQDDISLPNRLSTQLRFMRRRPEIAVAGTFVFHMGRTAAFDRLVTLPVEHEQIVQALLAANCLYHPSVVLRKSFILALGGYRAEYKNSEDYDLWLRAGRVYSLANIPVPLLRYRFSITGMTLGKKWEQVLFTQIALLSHLHPEWNDERLRQEAAAQREQMGKEWFLEQVARGTVRELIQLNLCADAVKLLWKFSGQLGPARMRGVVRDSASELFTFWRSRSSHYNL